MYFDQISLWDNRSNLWQSVRFRPRSFMIHLWCYPVWTFEVFQVCLRHASSIPTHVLASETGGLFSGIPPGFCMAAHF